MPEFGDMESSSEEDPVVDNDTALDLSKIFRQLSAKSEIAVSLKKTYILNLAINPCGTQIATGTSTNTCLLFDQTSTALREIGSPLSFPAPISGLRYLNHDPNALLLSTTDGFCHLYDVRSPAVVIKLMDDSNGGKNKPFTTLDVNQNDRILVVGTEQVISDAFLLFFDLRQRTLLGGYWESHQDDITALRFHPTDPDRLASGSTDGLLNVYNIGQPTEDDALSATFNTESSVGVAEWYQAKGREMLATVTHMNDLICYDIAEQEEEAKYTRGAVTTAMRRTSEIDCNLIGCHRMASEDGRCFLLATSNYNRGEALRVLEVAEKGLTPSLDLLGNRQIVRTSAFDEKTNRLFTAGEGGIVNMWDLGEEGETDGEIQGAKFKDKATKKQKRNKPY